MKASFECPHCHASIEPPSDDRVRDGDPDPLIKLSRARLFLGEFFDPMPTVPTVVTWIHDGLLQGRQIGRGDNWYVYKSSLDEFILNVQPRQKVAA